jgi:hypothetical protein
MRRIALTLVTFGAMLASGGIANAGGWHGHFGHYGHYHSPSVHFHTTYHPTHLHWTPYRGWHTHGHYHVTPHYTPGHFHW